MLGGRFLSFIKLIFGEGCDVQQKLRNIDS